MTITITKTKNKNKPLLLVILLAVLSVVFAFVFFNNKESLHGTLTLHFKAVVDNRMLIANKVHYQNPGGEGKFKIRAFQFFISNIKLIGEAGEYTVPDSYHLARFDNKDNSYTIVLRHIPRQRYEKIEFSIGVDEAKNKTIIPVGDLDPNSRMAWSWDVGYKFLLFEGGLLVNDVLIPLVYHVGFKENYRTMGITLPRPLFDDQMASVNFKVDIMALFTGATVIDMGELSNVKFDRKDAKLIADNYERMIVLDE